MARVFICYSHKDSAFVDRLTADLRRAGVATWRDVDDIRRDIAANTTSWRSAVDRGLRESTHMIVVLSPDAVKSKEVTAEWNWFVMDERSVYPVLCRDCEVPYRLYSLQMWDLRDDYAGALKEMIRVLPRTRPASPPAARPQQALPPRPVQTFASPSQPIVPWWMRAIGAVVGVVAAFFGVSLIAVPFQGWLESSQIVTGIFGLILIAALIVGFFWGLESIGDSIYRMLRDKTPPKSTDD